MTEKFLRELDLPNLSRRAYTPSPAAWEDQVLYFMMLDRFSDGNEQGYRGKDGRPVSGGRYVVEVRVGTQKLTGLINIVR